jgi:hypothetical protein
MIIEADGASVIKTVAVGETGEFSLEGLAPGDHEIVAFGPGHGRAREVVSVTSERSTISGLEIRLPLAGSVTGRVFDGNGAPVAGATFEIEYARPIGSLFPNLAIKARIVSLDWHRKGPSNSEGEFTIADIDPAAAFLVKARLDDGRTGQTSTLVLAPGEMRNSVIIVVR